jgi:hypothetical protein
MIEKYSRYKHKKQTKSQSNLNETSEPQSKRKAERKRPQSFD